MKTLHGKDSLENSGEIRKCSRTTGNWEAHHAPERPVSWVNKYPYGSNQSKPSSLFLALKNLSIWFIIQPHYPSSFPCMLWLPDSLYLVVCEVWIQEMVSVFSLWNVLAWNPFKLESTNYQDSSSAPYHVCINSPNIYWVLILGLTQSYRSKISPSSQGVKIVWKRVDGYITRHRVLKMAFL